LLATFSLGNWVNSSHNLLPRQFLNPHALRSSFRDPQHVPPTLQRLQRSLPSPAGPLHQRAPSPQVHLRRPLRCRAPPRLRHLLDPPGIRLGFPPACV
jgi:hypothetical protein